MRDAPVIAAVLAAAATILHVAHVRQRVALLKYHHRVLAATNAKLQRRVATQMLRAPLFVTLGALQPQPVTEKAVRESRVCDHHPSSPDDIRAELATSTAETAVATMWAGCRRSGGAPSPKVERAPRSESPHSLSSSLLGATPSLMTSSDMDPPATVAARGPPNAPWIGTAAFVPEPPGFKFVRSKRSGTHALSAIGS